MALELTLSNILNLAAIIIIGVSTIYGAKAVKRLYSDEFSATINWMLIIVEALFVMQLIIFLSFYFGVSQQVSTILVLLLTIFVAMLFFFATYKMIQFLEVYTFEHGKISEQSVKGLMKKKNGK
ncbi:MAG TPA: hypothetical protein VFF09_05055 [archaeon]|nr:hypothetical protein [archaeon]